MDSQPGTTTSGIGRRDVLLAGAGAALALATLSESVAAAATAKSGWRYCLTCRGLFAGKGTRSVGVCPAGGPHTPEKAYSYVLLADLQVEDLDLTKVWLQCRKCRGLCIPVAPPGIPSVGACPKGGTHAPTGPTYAVWKGTALPFMEENWGMCPKCLGLYWAGGANRGVCPADSEEHAAPLFGNFNLILLQ